MAKHEQAKLILAQDPHILEHAQKIAHAVVKLSPHPNHPHIKPRALLVGGFVRDAFRGEKSKDGDLEVYGVTSEDLIKLLAELFGKEKINLVGEQFKVIKVSVGGGIELDVSIPRLDSKQGRGHKGFEILGDPTLSIEEAARRRDFTMNSMAADPLTGEVFDPFGGQKDIEAGLLRATDLGHFGDDVLRVYRAVQFVARFAMSVEHSTMALMREMVKGQEFSELPSERITEELKKLLLKAKKPSIGFWLLKSLGVLELHFPEIHALVGVEQDPEWHPEGDVFIHTLMVVDEAAAIIRREGFSEDHSLQVMYGALGHDFGKPATTKFEDGRWRSKGHEAAGVEPCEVFGRRLKLSSEIVAAMKAVAAEHLKPAEYYRSLEKGDLKESTYSNAVRRMLKRVSPLHYQVLIAVSEADSKGRTIPGVKEAPYLPGIKLAEVVVEKHLEEEARTDFVYGRDILAMCEELNFHFPVTERYHFGKWIREVESLRDEGVVTEREQGLELVREKLLAYIKEKTEPNE